MCPETRMKHRMWMPLLAVLLLPARAAAPALAPAEAAQLRQQIAEWERLTPASRTDAREQLNAWLRLPAARQSELRQAAAAFDALPADEQAALRARFAALPADEQKGWRLGPALGPWWPRLQPLLAYVPETERAPLLATLHTMPPQELEVLSRLAFSTPPSGRDALRAGLLQQNAAARMNWLMAQMER